MGHTAVTQNDGMELYLLTWKIAHSILSSENYSSKKQVWYILNYIIYSLGVSVDIKMSEMLIKTLIVVISGWGDLREFLLLFYFFKQ